MQVILFGLYFSVLFTEGESFDFTQWLMMHNTIQTSQELKKLLTQVYRNTASCVQRLRITKGFGDVFISKDFELYFILKLCLYCIEGFTLQFGWKWKLNEGFTRERWLTCLLTWFQMKGFTRVIVNQCVIFNRNTLNCLLVVNHNLTYEVCLSCVLK